MRPYSFLGARQEAESKEPLSNRFMNKQVIGLYIYGVVAAIALTRENPLSILPVNVCWIMAQLVVYAGLFDRTKALNGTYVENFKEALNTLSDLALLMICTTLPLSLLSWSNSSIGFSILLAAVVKVLYWTSILILVWPLRRINTIMRLANLDFHRHTKRRYIFRYGQPFSPFAPAHCGHIN